jgi:uncharacterized protein YyaL (SSP411 family)
MIQNKLSGEKNPYLAQHAHNPVAWYPWGEEAFKRAREENKPIFLSIGYSTCHWCHVMEKESFEDQEVAEVLNRVFVCIKVDREERPDIDKFYMEVSQTLTGGGGWPLNIVLLPDKRPVFATTYMPKKSRKGVMGIIELAESVDELWRTDRKQLADQAEKIMDHLKRIQSGSNTKVDYNRIIETAFEQLKSNYDDSNGGFGVRPKFPTAHNYSFLLRYYEMKKDSSALSMVEKTLINMRLGGIFDQVGLGFHRYSTDPSWTIPHFEKMLYDQAMLLISYSEAYRVTRSNFYKHVCEEIFTFINRDLIGPEGLYYTALDADSEGQEGKYYTFSYGEIESVLGDEADQFCNFFGCKKEGNFIDEVTGRRNGRNILHIDPDSYVNNTRQTGIIPENIERMRVKLYNFRNSRIHPGRDQKALTDVNGLVLWGLVEFYRTTGNMEALQNSKRIADFIIENSLSPDGSLKHSYLEGYSTRGFIDDYAFFGYSLLLLYEATMDRKYLDNALKIEQYAIKHFSDSDGGFYYTDDKSEELVLRMKEGADMAVPSGNSVMAMFLIRLGYLTDSYEMVEIAESIFKQFSLQLESSPMFFTQMICAMTMLEGRSFSVEIRGNWSESSISEIKSITGMQLVPYYFIRMSDEDGKKEVLVCEIGKCDANLKSPEELRDFISANNLRQTSAGSG